jgi:hypothetical protein
MLGGHGSLAFIEQPTTPFTFVLVQRPPGPAKTDELNKATKIVASENDIPNPAQNNLKLDIMLSLF